jgi:hypothetical protein
MNDATGVPIAPHPLLAIVAGAVFGLLAGISLALHVDELPDTGLSQISEIGPFSAPAEMCSFNTFESAAANVPAMVSRCDYLFDERQYIPVGFRI